MDAFNLFLSNNDPSQALERIFFTFQKYESKSEITKLNIPQKCIGPEICHGRW